MKDDSDLDKYNGKGEQNQQISTSNLATRNIILLTLGSLIALLILTVLTIAIYRRINKSRHTESVKEVETDFHSLN